MMQHAQSRSGVQTVQAHKKKKKELDNIASTGQGHSKQDTVSLSQKQRKNMSTKFSMKLE